MGNRTYRRPTIADYGSLAEVTASMQVGGPNDTFVQHPPGHSCPTGHGSVENEGDPKCLPGGIGGNP